MNATDYFSDEKVVVRIEPINTNVLKSKYIDVKYNLDKLRVDVAKTHWRYRDSITHHVILKYACFQYRNLRFRIKDKATMEKVNSVSFPFGKTFYFYHKDEAESEGKCKFQEVDGDYVLYLEPFGPVGGEILIHATSFLHYIDIEFEMQHLEENLVFFEWDECDIRPELVPIFNQKNPQSPTDHWSLSSSVTTQLILITELSPKKLLTLKDGHKYIVLKDDLGDFGETLFDSHDDEFDFNYYQKEEVIYDQLYFNITADANVIQQICFNVPFRIAYEGEDVVPFSDPPRMRVLVLKKHCSHVEEYLDSRQCSYDVCDVTEIVPMTVEEKRERQKFLHNHAKERAIYCDFFKEN